MQIQNFKVTAPTRVDFAGGTLDIWPVYCIIGGVKTINLAIDLKAAAEFQVTESRSFRVEVIGPDGSKCEFDEPLARPTIRELPHALQFPALVIGEYLKAKPIPSNRLLKVSFRAEAPPRSGLGGSSALAVALARGMSRLFHDYTDLGWQWPLLQWVKDVEAGHLGTLTGTQDYLAALFGGLRCYQSRSGGIDALAYPDGVFEEFSERVMVLYSGEVHDSGLSNWEILRRALDGDRDIWQAMREISQISSALDDELRGRLSWKHIGAYLNDEWRLRKSVFKVETKRLEEILSFLHHEKVFGARVCGAAAGGSLVALVDPARKNEIAERCSKMGISVLKTAGSRAGVTIS